MAATSATLLPVLNPFVTKDSPPFDIAIFCAVHFTLSLTAIPEFLRDTILADSPK
jgi:hypothetical protein